MKKKLLKKETIVVVVIFLVALSFLSAIATSLRITEKNCIIGNERSQDISGLYYVRGNETRPGSDEGRLTLTQPEQMEYANCGIVIWFPFDESGYKNCSAFNIYHHSWFHPIYLDWHNNTYWAGYNTTNGSAIENGYIILDTLENVTEVNNHRLVCGIQYIDEPVTFKNGTDFAIVYQGNDPNLTTSPHQCSFIVLNVPDNETLNTTDSDADGLNDWLELYVVYTNPRDNDTDNDDVTDYDEYIIAGSDPNDYTDGNPYGIDPEQSSVELTGGNTPLTTCPAHDGPLYSYLKVTCIDYYGEPLVGLPPGVFQFNLNPISGTHWFDALSCAFTPVDPATNGQGEINFTIRGDTTIIGNLTIQVTVMNIPLHDVILTCKSPDYNLDGIVNLGDFVTFSGDYNKAVWRSDFTGDGFVALTDFIIFAQHYRHHN